MWPTDPADSQGCPRPNLVGGITERLTEILVDHPPILVMDHFGDALWNGVLLEVIPDVVCGNGYQRHQCQAAQSYHESLHDARIYLSRLPASTLYMS